MPITAQTLGVMLAGSVLGARRGALAVLTFLVLAAVGLPLLAGGRGGLAVFAGPSVGFLLGWVLGAWVVGWLVERRLPGRVVPAQVAAANASAGSSWSTCSASPAWCSSAGSRGPGVRGVRGVPARATP